MTDNIRKYRWGHFLAAAFCVVSLNSAGWAQGEPTGKFHDFCVGTCDPRPLAVATEIQQPAASPLGFSFSINFDEVVGPVGSGFSFLDIHDEQGGELLQIRAVRAPGVGGGRLVLSLEYVLAPGLVGTLPLGVAAGGFDCFWVERTLWTSGSPLSPGIRVLRTQTGQEYATGTVHITGSPALVRQGVLDLIGDPGGSVLISGAKLGEKCLA